MRSFTIGRISEIPIRINVSLLVFLPVLAYLIGNEVQISAYVTVVEAISPQAIDETALLAGNTPVLIGIVGAVGLFVGVLLHELGHSYAARYYGIEISSITLWIFGGLAQLESMSDEWDVEFWVALAGPVTSLGLGVLAYLALFVVPGGAPVVVFLIGWFAVINVSLAVFNMLPAFPMDGGRILRSLLARSYPLTTATRIAADLARVLAITMVLFATLVVFAPLLILVALFVYVAAGAEARATTLRVALDGITAGDLARRDSVRTVDHDTTVAALLDRMAADRIDAYPVVNNGRLVGLVTLPALQAVTADERATTTIESVADTAPPTCSPTTPGRGCQGTCGRTG